MGGCRSGVEDASVRPRKVGTALRELEFHIGHGGSGISGQRADTPSRVVVLRSVGKLFVYSIETNCSRPEVYRCSGGGRIVSGEPTSRWPNLASRDMPVVIHRMAWRTPA